MVKLMMYDTFHFYLVFFLDTWTFIDFLPFVTKERGTLSPGHFFFTHACQKGEITCIHLTLGCLIHRLTLSSLTFKMWKYYYSKTMCSWN